MRNDLIDARDRKDITQAALAQIVGRSQSVISRYESGEYSVDPKIAPVLAEALGLSVITVLYGKAA